MAILYRPILKAKQGEFEALENIPAEIRSVIEPIFEVSPYKPGKKKIAEPLTAHLIEVARKIAIVREGQSVAFDISSAWNPSAKIEDGTHVLTFLHGVLEIFGITANPVVGYDRWEDKEYREALQNIKLSDGSHYVIRLDGYAIDDMDDQEHFRSALAGILKGLSAPAESCGVVVDFGDLSTTPLEDLMDKADLVSGELMTLGFRYISIAGCSMPPTVDKAVPKINTAARVLRREMILWQSLVTAGHQITFGDYGVRNPMSADNVRNPHTNAKIRYTTDKHHYVERGESMKKAKGEQYRQLARKIMNSDEFMGTAFSWRDATISLCATKEDITGMKGSTKWIAIDTNHHCHSVISEVSEFRLALAKAKAGA